MALEIPAGDRPNGKGNAEVAPAAKAPKRIREET
jgi:hypothetical protein